MCTYSSASCVANAVFNSQYKIDGRLSVEAPTVVLDQITAVATVDII